MDRIQDAGITDESFTPRYAVELNPSGPLSIPPTPARAATLSYPRAARPVPQTGAQRYVYQCPLCQRRFYRKARNPAIRPHKGKNGWPCGGRQGIYRGLR